MEEMHRAGMWEAVWSFRALSGFTTVPPRLHQPRSPRLPYYWQFWKLHHEHIIDHLLHFQPFSLLKRIEGGTENSKLLSCLGLSGD